MSTISVLRVYFVSGIALSVCLLLSGCGGTEHPGTYPVQGTVTFNGQPVADATVNFHPVGQSRSSVGRTDAQGRYELTTFSSGDGAMPGEYRVAISKFELPPGAEAEDPEPPEELQSDAEALVPQNVLPERYASPDTSELTATVSVGPNTVDFDL